MKRKLLATFTLFILMPLGAALFYSCKACDDAPIDERPSGFMVMVDYIKDTFPGGQFGTYLDYEPYGGDSALVFDRIGMRFGFEFNASQLNERGLNFTNAAYACDPAIFWNRLKDFTITSNQDYNEDFPAGTDLAPLFTATPNYDIDHAGTIASLINVGVEIRRVYFHLLINTPPASESTHDLTFVITKEEDDTELSYTLNDLMIKP